MARSKRHFKGKGGQNYIWTATLINFGITTTSTILNLVASSDYDAAGGQMTATVLAIRGYLAFRAEGTNAMDVAYYVGMLDEDITSPQSPASVSTYVSEDIMWTGGFNKGAGAVEARQLWHEELNIKAKRKIKSGMNVNLIIRGTASSQADITGVVRCLLLMNA